MMFDMDAMQTYLFDVSGQGVLHVLKIASKAPLYNIRVSNGVDAAFAICMMMATNPAEDGLLNTD